MSVQQIKPQSTIQAPLPDHFRYSFLREMRGHLYEVDVIGMTAQRWARSPEAESDLWDSIRLGPFVIAVSVSF